MAYILSKVGQSFNVPVHIYEADTEEDMNSIDIQSIPMGSKCHIINDDKWYVLNSDGKWKAMPKQVQPDWNQNDDTAADYIKNKPLIVIPFKPEGKSYLTFSSPSSFTLKVNDATKHWDGTLEYFAPDKTWTVWDGTTTLSAVDDDGEYVLYLRGTGNTVITGNNENYRWVLTGSDIKCIGNIENLLDYATVASGAHPTMVTYCYRYMFFGCASLTEAPDLPATKLTNYCYSSMFQGCTSLTQTPALPATTLVDFCYTNMFYGCTSLTQAPALPATTLASSCYQAMFFGCASLTEAPDLPATKLTNYCYSSMFYGCTALTNAPSLPATTLADSCYKSMFQGCTSLTQAPALPATTLVDLCYQRMFYGCTGLTQVPALPATTLVNYCYRGMFQGCTSLKLSSTKTGEYTQEYRIPSSGVGTTATDALTDMFISTGGTFTGTPEINTTYYLSSNNMVVRETEIDTLNGYVGSMIDAAIAEHTSNPLNITGATVGQITKITAVDDTGKPTAWEAADMPSGVNWIDPENAESFGETGTEGEGSGGDTGGGEEPSYVTANLAAMYDFTKYEDGYQGEVEDLSGNGVVPTITGLDAYRSGRQGFVGGKLMMGTNTNATQAGISAVTQCTMTIDCDAVKSHPYSIEVYGFLRKHFKTTSPAGTLEYQDASVPGSWNMIVAQTTFSATTTVNGWNFVASENYAAMWGIGNAGKLEATNIELSIGGVNNTNVTDADTHLVYCVDGNLQKIYLNGVLVASAQGTINHGTDNILKVFPLVLAADLKMFRLYKSVLSDFDVHTNYQQAVSTYSGASPVALSAEVTAKDTVTRKAIKEMDNFPVTLARATYMNNSNTTVEDEINTLKSGGANSATVVRSAEVGDNGIVSFKNAAGITVFEADLAHMNVGALQLPRVYLTGSTVDMGADAPVKMAFKFADAEQTITGWANVEWQGNSSLAFPIKNYGIDLYEDEAMATKMDISVLPHMATDSYHLKANYIDPSNVKNLAGARLFNYICNTVGLTFPNSARCVVDGRPIEVYLNGKFNGIYTFNYKQSKSLFGMGNGNAEFIYRCEDGTGWGLFEGTSFPTKEEFDLIWEARYPKPKNLTHHNEIQRMLKWVNDATADEFKTNIGSYLNLQSCLIYRICGDIMAFRDNSAKNLTVCSWDGQVWYTIPYDMDMGMMNKTDSGMVNAGGNLWSKLDANFDAEKKSLYAQLRNAGMDANTIFKLYSDILYPIGVNGYTEDRKVKYDPYTNIDSRVSFVDFDDYIGFHKEFIQARIGLMDEKYGYSTT